MDETASGTELELLLWREGEERLLVGTAPTEIEAGSRLTIARALIDAGRWSEALPVITSLAADDKVRARARALLAYLRYYQGDFTSGIVDADAALEMGRADPAARGEAHLYASVNLIALNDATRAEQRVRLAEDATRRVPRMLRDDLRFRVARQLVHVLVAAGRYLEAATYAEEATRLARVTRNRRAQGLAAYLRGHVAAARGHGISLGQYSEALTTWGPAHESLQRWVRYCIACFLRDTGDRTRARLYRTASGLRLSWEEPLFDLADRRPATEPTASTADEEPFCSATSGLIQLCADQAAAAEGAFTRALAAFESGGMDHYRRGAAFGLAASYASLGRIDLARELVINEVAACERADLRRWPWWHSNIAAILARPEISGASARRFAVRPSALARVTEGDVSSDALSEREREVLGEWLGHPHLRRAELAARLGISDASLRNHINRVRRKLGVRSERGLEPLRERVGEFPSAGRLAL